MEYNKILVVCVDRDADILRKVGEDGPIYGREKVLDVAVRLGLADPLETDANALFESVRLTDKFKKEGKDVEVVALVGSEYVGVESDTKLSAQFEDVLKKFKADGVVVVSDGAEDEYIIPVIQSKSNIISVRRVVVRQSERLESTYYVILDFLKGIVEDPRLARLLIGVPGIAFILYMLLPSEYGAYGTKLIIGTVGVFLVIKGFGFEGTVQKVVDELKASFVPGRISFFTYVVAALIVIVGLIVGYDEISSKGMAGHLREGMPYFVSASINFFTFGVLVSLVGKSIDATLEKRGIRKYVILAVFVLSLKFILQAVSLFLLGQIDNIELAMRVTVGLALSILAFLLIRSAWKVHKAGKAKA